MEVERLRSSRNPGRKPKQRYERFTPFWELLISAPTGVSRFRMLWDPGSTGFRRGSCMVRVLLHPRALTCFFALVKFGLVLAVGVSVTVSGFVGAEGSVGTTTSGQVDLLGGNSRPPWKSLPASCLEVGIVTARQLVSCTIGGRMAKSDSGFPLFGDHAVCHSG